LLASEQTQITVTVIFYGSIIFRRKAGQFSETPRKAGCLELALKNAPRNITKTC